MLRWACHARAGVPRRAHRQFFTPTLHALQRKQCVPYSSKQVYAVVADVERYTEFLPFCSASRICARHGPASFDATLTLGFLAFSETYTSRVTLEPPCGVTAVSTDTNLFSHLSTRWRLTDGREPGTCELHFVLEMQLKSILQDQVCVSVCRAPLAAAPLAAAPLAAPPPGAPRRVSRRTHRQPLFLSHAQALQRVMERVVEQQVAAFRRRCDPPAAPPPPCGPTLRPTHACIPACPAYVHAGMQVCARARACVCISRVGATSSTAASYSARPSPPRQPTGLPPRQPTGLLPRHCRRRHRRRRRRRRRRRCRQQE
jgi:coenzyme Q-binding protein COQ10